MGNQIFGGTTDMATAKRIAERYAKYTPHHVKDIHVQYDRFDQPRNYEFIYYTPEEQNLMAAQLLMETEPFRFLVGISTREGQLASHLDLVSLAPLQSYYPVDIVNQIKADLMERDGIPVAAMPQMITAGPQQPAVQPSPQPEQPAAKIWPEKGGG